MDDFERAHGDVWTDDRETCAVCKDRIDGNAELCRDCKATMHFGCGFSPAPNPHKVYLCEACQLERAKDEARPVEADNDTTLGLHGTWGGEAA